MKQMRTWMFVPGIDERKMAKASQLPVDAVIYDLEDAVAANEKASARQLVKAQLQSAPGSNGTPARYVRVNAADSPFFAEDVQEVCGAYLSGIVLPKAEEASAIARLEALLDEWRGNGFADSERQVGTVEIVPLIESARGLYHAYEIARASKRIKRLMFGSIDFALDIQADLTRDGQELLFARSQLVVVSRAAGIGGPIDAVFPDVHDTEGLAGEARRARHLGFQGKLLIHPNQIGPVREVFAPVPEQVAEAEQIVAAFEEALAVGVGSIQVGGKLVDAPVYERAKRTIEEAREISLLTNPIRGEER
ncbi:CoA ester lyase [Brevibacillus brevis]|uniref:CoA ester lyase n=1 Tax=Brevibacillus brevis TaxID=1393 RepID=A0ABY9T8B1_BREBE|nr:CoA ester lyase [Brevibacillus brevis]WNC16335.1 CoA ester lyase [Brevibacillus brevis]